MKRILSLLLACMMLLGLCSLTACGANDSLVRQANKALKKAPYHVITEVQYTSEDANLQYALSALASTTPITVDGDNIQINTRLQFGGGISINRQLLLIDRTLYMTLDAGGSANKNAANLTADNYQHFCEKNYVQLPLEYGDFKEVTHETGANGETILHCTNPPKRKLDLIFSQVDSVIASLAQYDSATFTCSNFGMDITILNGKYQSVILRYDFTMTVNGTNTTACTRIESTYSYDNVPAISAPADADSYIFTTYETLFED